MAGTSGGSPCPPSPCRPPPRTDGKPPIKKMPSFTIFDAVFIVISMLTFLVDVGTDLHLVARYFLAGSLVWAFMTLSLVVVPAIVVMGLSLRWHLGSNQPITKVYWASHFCLWGIMHRYILMFKAGVVARRTNDYVELYYQQSDVCMLRMFESFLESAPQLVLQLYIMLSHHNYSVWTGLTAFTSMVSLGWAIAAYTKAMRNIRLDKHKMTVSGLVLQTVWRVGMIGARVLSLALVATVLESWLLLIMALHLVTMFLWVVSQKTGFSTIQWEERIFNFIMAVTYCFCFFNLREGQARWRMLTFYLVVVTENMLFVVTYFFLSPHKLWLKYAALGSVSGLMVLGLTCMVLYYRFLHPVGPLNLFQGKETGDPEAAHKESDSASPASDHNSNTRPVSHKVSLRRDIKYMYPVESKANMSLSVLSAPGVSLESSPDASLPPQPVYQRPTGTMCSVQDLLANISCSNDFQVFASPERGQGQSVANSDPSKDEARDVEHVSPSSFERSVTRELNFRLSSSDFQLDRRALNSSQTNVEECDGVVVVKHSEGQTEASDEPLKQGEESHLDLPHCHNEAGTDDKEKDISNDINVASQPARSRNNTSSLRREHKCAQYSSPNSIGLPLLTKCSSHTSLNSFRRNESQRNSASILRTSVRRKGYTVSDTDVRLTSLPHLTASTINVTSKSQDNKESIFEDPTFPQVHVPNVELAVIDRMHIIETESSGVSSESHSDYENIYENKDDPRKNLPPKPLNLIAQNMNDTQTTQSSLPHDYENICAVNINREMWGVRHWKTYSDIEDRIHDLSTYRERLKMLDSTLTSSFYSDNNSILKGIQSRKSISAADDCESVLSRSLPDLSTLKLETCFEVPEQEVEETQASPNTKDDNRLMDVLNRLRATRPLNKSNSVDYIPNYETIWVGDIEKQENDNCSSIMTASNSKSSLVITIGDVREKESLCNLYYSTMSDLSFRYYSERMRRNCSGVSTISRQSTRNTSREMTRAISVPDSKTLLEVSEMIEEQRKIEEKQMGEQKQALGAVSASTTHFNTQNTPVSSVQLQPRRKFSILREKFEHPSWTPLKSPLKRRVSAQRRNSLQDRTAKALHAGMKVFRRPRVHVITPKKEDNKDTPRLKSPFKSKTVTPTSALRIKADTPTEQKINSKGENETVKAVHRTPQVRTPADHKLTKSTPKTSTPDETKSAPRAGPVAIAPNRVKKISEGPKTSTPEGNKQLPQMSILSAVSSVVASPDATQTRVPLSENIYLSRVSSKTLAMQVNKESECTQKNLLKVGKSVTSLKLPTGDENCQNNIISAQSGLSTQTSEGVLGLKGVRTSPLESHRYPGGQPMFSGALGLPRFQPDARPTIISVTSTSESPHNQQNVSISHIILSSPQSPKINMQKSTLSPNSKIFGRRL